MSDTPKNELNILVDAAEKEGAKSCSNEALTAYLAAKYIDPLVSLEKAREAANRGDKEDVEFELAAYRRAITTASSFNPIVKHLSSRSIMVIELRELVALTNRVLAELCPAGAIAEYVAAGNQSIQSLMSKASKAAEAGDKPAVQAILKEARNRVGEAVTLFRKKHAREEKISQERELSSFWANFATAPKPAKQADWLWSGWLRAGLPALLCGHGESGKGILLTCLSVCVAAGAAYLGHPTKKGRVLIISAEDDQEELLSRLHDIAEALELNTDEVRQNIDVLSTGTAGVAPALLTKDMQPTALLREIQRQMNVTKPVLVILDTLAAMAPAGADITQATASTQYICCVAAALKPSDGSPSPVVLSTHHLRKPSKEVEGSRPSINDVRDSSAIVGSMRSVLILHKNGLSLNKCNGRRRVNDEYKVSKEEVYELSWKSAPECHNGALELKHRSTLSELQAEGDQNAADEAEWKKERAREERVTAKSYEEPQQLHIPERVSEMAKIWGVEVCDDASSL